MLTLIQCFYSAAVTGTVIFMFVLAYHKVILKPEYEKNQTTMQEENIQNLFGIV